MLPVYSRADTLTLSSEQVTEEHLHLYGWDKPPR